MKKAISLMIVLAFTALPLLISCGNGSGGVRDFKYENGAIVSEDGKRFIAAPIGFQPCGMGEKCAVKDGAFDLYVMTDPEGTPVSSDEWMSGEYAGAATTVYYREGISLPSFEKIDYSKCFICKEDESVISFATIEDKELIGKLISGAASGKEMTMLDEPAATYTLKFYSEEYPALFYSVDYLIFDDASYLFVRDGKTYADVTGLIDDLIPSAE